LVLKQPTERDDARTVTTSTPLAALRLGEERPGWSPARLARVRAAVDAGTYRVPPELVAEALLASSLLGPAPSPDALGRAC
jgi:hypothetical protein